MTFFHSAWSATPPNGGAKYRLRLRVDVVAQNLTANTTTVEWLLQMQKDRDWDGFFEYTATWAAAVDGSVASGTAANPNAAWLGWASTTIAGSGRKTITHTDDGSKSISVSASYSGADVGWAIGDIAISATTLALPTIDRATVPTVTPSPASIADTVTIGLPRAVASYVHDVEWVCGTMSGTVGTGLGASTTWTVPDVEAEYAGKSLKPIVLTVTTKLAGDDIGVEQVTLFAQLPPAAPAIDVPPPFEQFDVRARLVTYSGGKWEAKRQLPISSVSMVDPLSATSTCEITISKLHDDAFTDYSIVDIDVFNGTRWIFTDHRFILTRISDDGTDQTKTSSHSGMEFVDYFLKFGYVQKDVSWENNGNPGMILKSLIDEAQGRGWGPRIDYDFTTQNTSLGEPFANKKIDLKVTKGTPISQVLSGLVEDGLVEYRTEYHDDKAWLVLLNPGTGSNYADPGASPVVNLALASLTSAPRRASIEDRITRVTGEGDDDILVTREIASFDADVFGQLEGWIKISGVSSKSAIGKVSENALRDSSTATSERTFQYDAKYANPNLYPYSTFLPGDWVVIPDDNDSTETDRVSQVTMSKDADSTISVTALTGDRILSGTASLAKRQKAQVGGAISGGNQTTLAPIDGRIPLGPIVTATTSAGYWNSAGVARAEVTLTWNETTTAISGSDIDVDMYEIWWRSGAGSEWAFRGATNNLTIELPDWDTNTEIELRIRGRSAAGVFGQFSLNNDHTTGAPSTAMAAPNVPTVTANALGTLFIAWDGEIDGGAPPVQFSYTRAEISIGSADTFTPAGVPLLQAGSTSLDPGTYGAWDIRLIAVDRIGVESAASSTVSITTVDPGLILRVPKAPTGLAYTAGASFSEDGASVLAWFDLTWDAVTLDVDDDAITVSGYEIWGHVDSETDMRLMASTEGVAVRAMVEDAEVWDVEVRAFSDAGKRGGFSTTLTATADAAISALGAPTTPTVTTTRSMIRINWDGLIAGSNPPNGFRYVKAEYAPTDTMVYVLAGQKFTRGGGDLFIPAIVGQDYTVRLIAVDGAGVSGNPSTTATVTVTGITTTDFTPAIENMLSEPRIETSSESDEGVKLYDGGIVAFNAAGDPTVFINAADGTIYFADGIISGDAIVAGSISATKLDVGSVVTTLVASNLGASLNLASNDSVNILVDNAVEPVQDDVDGVITNVESMQTYYKFGADGAEITSPDSPFAVQISNSQISMVASGVTVSYWNAAGMVVPSLIADQTATIGSHQFRKEEVRTTIRSL